MARVDVPAAHRRAGDLDILAIDCRQSLPIGRRQWAVASQRRGLKALAIEGDRSIGVLEHQLQLAKLMRQYLVAWPPLRLVELRQQRPGTLLINT